MKSEIKSRDKSKNKIKSPSGRMEVCSNDKYHVEYNEVSDTLSIRDPETGMYMSVENLKKGERKYAFGGDVSNEDMRKFLVNFGYDPKEIERKDRERVKKMNENPLTDDEMLFTLENLDIPVNRSNLDVVAKRAGFGRNQQGLWIQKKHLFEYARGGEIYDEDLFDIDPKEIDKELEEYGEKFYDNLVKIAENDLIEVYTNYDGYDEEEQNLFVLYKPTNKGVWLNSPILLKSEYDRGNLHIVHKFGNDIVNDSYAKGGGVDYARGGEIMQIRTDGHYIGHATKEGDVYVTYGQIGEGNEYESIDELKAYLKDFGINEDDVFWSEENFARGGEIKSMYIETFGEELEEDVSDDMARQILIEHYDNQLEKT
jgi:hypothetical protein